MGYAAYYEDPNWRDDPDAGPSCLGINDTSKKQEADDRLDFLQRCGVPAIYADSPGVIDFEAIDRLVAKLWWLALWGK